MSDDRNLTPVPNPGEQGQTNGLRKNNPSAIAGVTAVVPALFANAGERAAFSVIEFFTAHIRNPNTRAAYSVAVREFSTWCEQRGLALHQLRSPHVGLYIEGLTSRYGAPTTSRYGPTAIDT